MADKNLTPGAVERLALFGTEGGAFMAPATDGRYVRFTDHDTLARQNVSLQAEVERLNSVVCGLTERCDDAREVAEKAIVERDAAMALLADAYGADTGGSVIQSRLADAERDMRQRAANTASLYGQGKQGIAASEMIQQAILALPLKHAEKEEKQ